MTTSKGPWSYDSESGYVTTKDATGDWTAHRGQRGVTKVCIVESLDGISNGDLIAAAPDMRDALRAMLAEFNETAPGIVHDELAAIAKARAALAKAER